MAPQTKKETYLLWDVKAILDDFEGPNDEMIQKAKIYEEDDRVGPCTDLEHNDNCGIRIGPKLLEYYWLRRSGLINQKPLEQWGCEPVRDKNEKIVASAFRDIDWNGGFTGRGMSQKSAEWTEAIGPHDETIPGASCASPLELNRARGQRVFNYGEERSGPLDQTPESSKEEPGRFDNIDEDDDEDVGPLGERMGDESTDEDVSPSNETRPASDVDPSGEMSDILSQNGTESSHEGSDDSEMSDEDDVGPLNEGFVEELWPSEQSRAATGPCTLSGARDMESEAAAQYLRESDEQLKTCEDEHCPGSVPEAVEGSGKKRGRKEFEELENLGSGNEVRKPKRKRLRISEPGSSDVADQVKTHQTRSRAINFRYKKEVWDSLDDTHTDDDNFVPEPKRSHRSRISPNTAEDKEKVIVKLEDDDGGCPRMKVRPTYEGWFQGTYRNIVEENEADDIVVMSVNSCNPLDNTAADVLPTPPWTPRPWVAKEAEALRFWVQDYGVKDWKLIAWCLGRSVEECQSKCGEIILARNVQAKRDALAGLPQELVAHFAKALALALSASSTLVLYAQSTVPAATGPRISQRVLRPRNKLNTPKLPCGEIAYDPKARSLPRVEKSRALVDSNGDQVPGTGQEVGSALAQSWGRKPRPQRLKLTVKPRVQIASRDDGSSDAVAVDQAKVRQAGVAKHYDSGVWHYGASRRAGHQKR